MNRLRITGVSLHNICTYDDFSCSLLPGLTAVCGPNGFGKTSLLRGLAYGLTGIVDGTWGNQCALQKDGTLDPGYAEVTFTDGGTVYRIRRFSTSGVKFPDSLVAVEQDGSVRQLALRRQAVDAQMQQLLGVPCSLMFQTCWGRQGQLDLLLTASGATVNTLLQSLFDMKRLEKLRDRLKASSDAIADLPDVSGKIREHEAALAALPVPPSDDELSEASAALQRAADQVAELRSVTGSGMSASARRAEEARLHSEKSGLEREIAELESVPEPYCPGMTAEAARVELDGASARVSQLKQYAQELKMARMRAEQDRNSAEEAMRRCSKDHADKSAAVGHDEECSLCHGVISDRESYERDKWMLVTGYPSREAFDVAHGAELATLSDRVAEAEARMRSADSELEGTARALSEAEETEGMVRSVAEQLAEHSRWQCGHDRCLMLRDRLAQSAEALDRLNRIPEYGDDIGARLAEAAEDRRRAEARLTELRDRRASVDSDRRFLEKTLAAERSMQEQVEINDEARGILSDLRSVFSANRAQAAFLKSKIAELNSYISQYLKFTQMPFSLYMNEETHVFEYVSADGYVHPACHLSGAQKSMSAVVLQMAILSLIRPNMNLYLIDEPSEALDDANKIIMAQLFDRMNRLLPALEGVMLIVARDPQTLAACENEIRIGESRSN